MTDDLQKIPEKFVVDDLLRIKGENESYIEELEEEIKQLNRQLEGKPHHNIEIKLGEQKKHLARLQEKNKTLEIDNGELKGRNRTLSHLLQEERTKE